MGSTAIPGLRAKPVIDMLAIVPQVEALDARGAAFAAFSAGSAEISRHLDFRDYLRAHSDVRDAYAAL